MRLTDKTVSMAAVALAALLALASAASAQPLQQPIDPAVLALKLQGTQFLLDTREKQLAELTRQAEAERAYWAAYVAGLKPTK